MYARRMIDPALLRYNVVICSLMQASSHLREAGVTGGDRGGPGTTRRVTASALGMGKGQPDAPARVQAGFSAPRARGACRGTRLLIPCVDGPWGSRRFDTGRLGVACAHVSGLLA